MRNIKRIALLLSLVLLASMTGCARKSRRPALPAAPLQASLTAESADTGETASTDEMAPMMKSAAVSASRAVVMEEPVETLLEQFAEPLENEDALYQDYVQAHRSAYVKLRQRPEEGSTVRAAVSYDEGQTWQEQGGVTGSGRLRDCVLHVRPRRCRRLRLRIYGVGGCRVYSLTAVYEK